MTNPKDCEVKMSSDSICSKETKGCEIDHNLINLGHRLMAIPGYLPAPGMIDLEGRSVSDVLGGMVYLDGDRKSLPISKFVPNLSRQATKGELLGQIRELFEDPLAYTQPGPSEFGSERAWCVCFPSLPNQPPVYRPTEEEALVAAREFVD